MTPTTSSLARAGLPAILTAFAAVLLTLLPLLGTPHVSDDVLNYSFHWLSDGEFARATTEEIKYWTLAAGRIFFFSTLLKNSVFQIFETVHEYKAYLLAMNLLCALAFTAYLRAATRSWLVPVAALLALPVLIQFRDFHDPVISFNGLFQISVALIFICLGLHLRYLNSSRRSLLYLCVAGFVLNLFFYELAAITLVLVFVQEWVMRRDGAPRHGTSKALAIVLAVYLALVIACRVIGAQMFGMADPKYGLSLAPISVLQTMGKQLLAVVPFSFSIFRPNDGNWGIHALPESFAWLGDWRFFVAVPTFVGIAWTALWLARAPGRMEEVSRLVESEKHGFPTRAEYRVLSLIAGALLLVPAAMIGVVSRYQGAFGVGNGYSTVYAQEFGAALGIALFICRFLSGVPRLERLLLAAVSIALGVASAGNLVNNYSVAAKLRESWGPQYVWSGALRSSDFAQLCGGLGVVVVEPKPWTQDVVLQHAGFRAVPVEAMKLLATAGSDTRFNTVCLARTVELLGRRGVAYARAGPSFSPPGYQLRSSVYLVLPLVAGEARNELRLGEECSSTSRASFVAGWKSAANYYGLFVLDLADTSKSFTEDGFSLPCERIAN